MTPQSLSARFAEYARRRKALGISLEDAATALFIAPGTLNAYECGYMSATTTADRYEAFIANATESEAAR
jgi:transcriptional regulator with XRE-family HTH domain